jgi:DNA gyrase subunit A
VRPNTELQRQQAFKALPPDSRLLIQADGAVKIVTPQMLGRLHLDEAAELAEQAAPAQLILPISTQPGLLAFSADGRVALLRWEFAGQQPGSLEKFLPESLSDARLIQVLPLPSDGSLGLLSSDGRFKRLPLEEFQELSGRAATVLKLKEGVELQRVVACRDGEELVVASSTGRLLRLAVNETTLPVMGRTAQGPILLRLLPGETVVGAAGVRATGSVLLASRQGQIKRLSVASLRPCERGDLGQIGLRFLQRGDGLVDLRDDQSAVVGVRLAHTDSRSLRLRSDGLEAQDCTGTGRLLSLQKGDTLQQLVPLIHG